MQTKVQKHESYLRHREKNIARTRKYKKEHPHPEQIEKMREYQKQYYLENKEKELERSHRWYQEHKKRALDSCYEYRKRNAIVISFRRREMGKNLRKKVFELLGDKCIRCGFVDIRALQVDHVNGGGTRQSQGRRKKCNVQYYKTLIREIQNGSREYQLLCANCNWIKRDEMKELPKEKYSVVP